MASTSIAWGDGTSDYLTCTYSASSGNQTVTISSSLNKGTTSRKKTLKVSTASGVYATMTITQIRDSIGSMKIGSTFAIPYELSIIEPPLYNSVSTMSLENENGIKNEGNIANENLGIASEMTINESLEDFNNQSEEEIDNTTNKSSNGFFSMLKRLFS